MQRLGVAADHPRGGVNRIARTALDLGKPTQFFLQFGF